MKTNAGRFRSASSPFFLGRKNKTTTTLGGLGHFTEKKKSVFIHRVEGWLAGGGLGLLHLVFHRPGS